MALIFQDSFTGADGPLVGHVPEVPGAGAYVVAYDGGGSNPEALFLSGNHGRFAGLYSRYDVIGADVPGASTAREYSINITLTGTVPGAMQEFLCRMGVSIFSALGFGIRRPIQGNSLDIYAMVGAAGTIQRHNVGTIQVADGTVLRVGMTQISTTPTFRFWYQVAGGARLYLSPYTFADALEDGLHQRFGFGGGLLAGYNLAGLVIDFDNFKADTVPEGANVVNLVEVPVGGLSTGGLVDVPNASARFQRARPQPFNLQGVESGGTRPATPVLTVVADANAATLQGSPFSSPRPGAQHRLSRWQVDERFGDFGAPVYDSGWVMNHLRAERPPLEPFSEYVARVAYADDLLAVSEWSTPVGFTTLGADVTTPWQSCGVEPASSWEQCSA